MATAMCQDLNGLSFNCIIIQWGGKLGHHPPPGPGQKILNGILFIQLVRGRPFTFVLKRYGWNMAYGVVELALVLMILISSYLVFSLMQGL